MRRFCLFLFVFFPAAVLSQDSSTFRYEKVVDGIQLPWGMVWLPDGDMLVTNRNGELHRVTNGVVSAPLAGVPPVYLNGQSGLLDIELHPDYADNGWLYLSYASSDGEGEGGNTAIMRARLGANGLTDQEVLNNAVPNTDSRDHFGSRIEFDNEGYLYFSIGDRYDRDVNPQDVTRDGGKIYRLHDDGRFPDDNPFADRNPAVFSIGHPRAAGSSGLFRQVLSPEWQGHIANAPQQVVEGVQLAA